MKFSVSVSTNVMVGDEQAFNVHLKSQGQLEQDNAVFWVKVVDKGIPDLSINSGAWNDVYEQNTPVSQITNFTIEKGYTNHYWINVGNDKSERENLKLTAAGNKGDFSVFYFVITNSITNNINNTVTNNGAIIPVAANSTALLKIDVTL